MLFNVVAFMVMMQMHKTEMKKKVRKSSITIWKLEEKNSFRRGANEALIVRCCCECMTTYPLTSYVLFNLGVELDVQYISL